MNKGLPILMIVIFMSCNQVPPTETENVTPDEAISTSIKSLNAKLVDAAKTKSFDKVAEFYEDDAILLAEYNPLIDGKKSIREFYTQLFDRQNITDYQKETKELFHFTNTVLEIGEFTKTCDNDVQNGKYWNYWEKKDDGNLTLIAEAFGFNHPIEDPTPLRISSIQDTTLGLSTRNNKEIPIELAAYDAMNENIVRDRDTKKVINAYTEDGAYYPFASPAKVGREELSKHYHDYHAGPVKIDSVEVWTYDFHLVDDGVIKYTKFYVDWTVPDFSGNTQGTGIIYYKRQPDNSLKIYRQIGLHILNQ